MKKCPILCVLVILLLLNVSPVSAVVVLLHNGHVIQGKEVSLSDGIYHVNIGTGQIRIAADRVERAFDKIEDVYRWKRHLIRVGNHSEHIELARWCLKYDLLDLAQGELVDAELAEFDTPMVDYLQRRLTAKRKAKISETPRQFTPTPNMKPVPTVPAALRVEGMIPSKKLDAMVKTISTQSMAQFTSTIQPILLNNCATGGCHVTPGKDKMQLFRSGLAGKAGRRTTQRNLYSVMEWITQDRPDYSPLVTVPLRPHGKAPAMVKGHREEYRRLVYWVFQVSREQNQKSRNIANRLDFQSENFGGTVQAAMHTEPVNSSQSVKSKKSIVQETLDLIPPEGANLQKRGKDGRLEPIYPSDKVTSTSPFRKALAINPGMLKKFIDKQDKSENK